MPTMWKREKPGLWIAALGVLGLALAALWILQTRWLGELQRAEQERILGGLRRSARFVSDAVDREVGSTIRLLFPRPARGAPDGDGGMLSRWQQAWEERGANSLLRHFYQVELTTPGGLKLERFDPETERLVSMPWPAAWTRLGPFLRNAPQPEAPGFFQRNGSGGGLRAVLGPGTFEEGKSLLLVAPRFRTLTSPQAPPRWTLAELDARALAETVIPRLIREHLGDEYQFSLRQREGGRVLVASHGAIANPDLTVELVRGGFGGGGAFRGRGEPMAPPPPLPETARDDGPPRRFEGPPGLWELDLRHQAGGVASLVAAGHRRNLWMAFGVLAVMAGALGVVLVNARRSAALARQQMEFVAAVSHELRTPIAAMRSAADNLADGIVRNEEQARRYGAMLREQGRTLGDLMEQILAFAGIASHAPPKDPKPSEVGALVDDALKACEPLIASSACTVEKDVDARLPSVVADANWVGLALRNLVQNAVVHGGGKWIRVEARPNGSPDSVQIAVEDRGQGIEPAELTRIFEPFYRGRGALEKAARGAGLGLAIARRIAEAHGGSLKAESQPGVGSRFILSLPAAKS